MGLLDVVFPKRCVGCGTIGRYFCDHCVFSIRIVELNEAICPVCERSAVDGITHPRCRTRYSLDGLTSFFHYDGIVRKAIKALKYSHVTDLAREFVALAPSVFLPQVDTLIPVPLHSLRLRERGFNQSEVLGKIVAEKLRLPFGIDILKRTRITAPQVEMDTRETRLTNMNGVFSVIQPVIKQYDNQAMMLFDDVFTTGATMRAAGNILKRNGIKYVWAVTMAR